MLDPISIGIMLAGAAITAQGQNSALKKQQALMAQTQREQLNARNQATDVAMRQVREFDPTDRQTKQNDIAQTLEGDYRQAVEGTPITAQGVQVGSTIPNASATGDYLAASAREKAKSVASLRDLASLMGRIGSAGQLRRDEAVGIGDTAGAIGRIQTNANNMAGINDMQANSITPSLGSQLIGGALSSYGAGSLATAGLGKAAPALRGTYAAPGILDMTRGPWN